ncbi:S8 family serine peptidase, partial [Brevundimonas sp. SPF441]|uniref:S8 family serine peptidase n=1 Tax=Brevundimonas sp. SPF441 TaxID=2663795 RepID=UPI00129D4A92
APPLYPAAYPQVVGVTAVNAQGRVIAEAGRGDQVDYAAPGADMAAAGRAGSFVSVRGTSFAAPLVAGLIGKSGRQGLNAIDAGASGRDAVYGQGVVGLSLRTPPAAVGARGRLPS